MSTLLDKFKRSKLKQLLPNKQHADYKKIKSILKVVEGLSELQTEFEKRRKGNGLTGHFVGLADVFREYQTLILDVLDYVPKQSKQAKPITPVTFKKPNSREVNIVYGSDCEGCTDAEKKKRQAFNNKDKVKPTIKPEYLKAKEAADANRPGAVGSKIKEDVRQISRVATPNDNTPLTDRIDLDSNPPKNWQDVYHALGGNHNDVYNYCMVMSIKNVNEKMSVKDLSKAIFTMLVDEGLVEVETA